MISFIMPAYNVAELIEESIAAINSQSFKDWELIIVDDCSTDATYSLAQSLSQKDERIRVIRLQSNSGGAYQPRKKAIEAARYDIVAPLDADDLIDPDYLKELLEVMQSTGSEIVYPTMYSYSEGKTELLLPKDQNLLLKPRAGKEYLPYTLHRWRMNCNGGLIKRDLYHRAFEKFDSGISHSRADELLTRQMLLLAEKVTLSPAKYYYRTNPESVTRKKSMRLFDFIDTNIALVELISKEYAIDSPEYELVQRQHAEGLFDALKIMNKYGFTAKERKEVYQMLGNAKRYIDRKMLKRILSWKFRILYAIGFKPSRIVLSVFWG